MNIIEKAEEWIGVHGGAKIQTPFVKGATSIIVGLVAEIEQLKTRLAGRTYYHDNAAVEVECERLRVENEDLTEQGVEDGFAMDGYRKRIAELEASEWSQQSVELRIAEAYAAGMEAAAKIAESQDAIGKTVGQIAAAIRKAAISAKDAE